jgi:hypothetical protein
MAIATLKSQYLDGASGITQKLHDAFILGRRFIRPAVDNIVLPDAVAVATSAPHFTIANSGSNALILAGYTVVYNDGSADVERVVASPVTLGSTFNATAAPASAVSGKSLKYSSPRPSSFTTLSNEIIAAAAAGKTKFSIVVETVDNPAYLRLQGHYMKAYFAGIESAMAEEGFFQTYEFQLSLDTTDTLSTKVKFDFTLC